MARRPDTVGIEDTLRCVRGFVEWAARMDQARHPDGKFHQGPHDRTDPEDFMADFDSLCVEKSRALDQARALGIDVAGIKATAQG